MSTNPGIPTIDQLQVFIQVVDAGSFTSAARRMHRALSVISYIIGNLEAQLGVCLFDRRVSRKPQLTEAGRVVLAEARRILDGVSDLRARVASLSRGLEAELHIVLDTLLPAARIVDALRAFSDHYPSVEVHLHTETLGAVASLVLEKTAAMGVSGPFTSDIEELHRISLGTLRMVPVASPKHPLASRCPPLPGATRDHVQLVVYDRSALTKGQDFSVSARHTWRLGDFSAKHMLLRAGVGWGMMPLTMVSSDLANSELVQLDLPDLKPFDYPIEAIYRIDTPPGPAAVWLIERFRLQLTIPELVKDIAPSQNLQGFDR